MTNPQRLQQLHEKMARIQWNIAQADRMIGVHKRDGKYWADNGDTDLIPFCMSRIAINRAIIARLQNYYDNLKTDI